MFPNYKQYDTMDCGPTCLRIIARFYGREYTLQSLREKCYITREGVSLLGISEAAESIGFRTNGVKLIWEQLRDDVNFPCIAHWNQNHFIVVYRIKKGKKTDWVYVSDPAHGLLKYDREQFLRHWISDKNEDGQYGSILEMETTPLFYNHAEESGQRKLTLFYLLNYLRPYTRYIIQLFLAMIVGSILSLLFPFITQSVVDYGINGSDLHFVVMALIAQVILTFGQTANDLIRSWLMLHVTTRISIAFIADFLNKLMHLPISFFDIKMVGDIIQRIGDNNRIQSFLTGSLIGIIFSVVTFIVYAIIMAYYHLNILLIFLSGSLLYVIWVVLFLKKRRDLDYKRFQEASSNQSNLVQLVNGMQEIKLNNCEKQKRWEWERIQARLFKVSVEAMSLGQVQRIGGLFIDQSKNVLISFLAAKAVIDGDMTLGMMMAMQYILGQLNAPISQFIGFIQEAQDARISMERLGEIHGMKDEETAVDEKIKIIPSSADIELKDVSFQYEGPHSEYVLKDVNLKIAANKVTAIVGMSGSGKTTLLKLLLGFYQPVKGEITLGEVPLYRFSDSQWRRSCGVVMQEGFIFSDTLENNIGIVDELPDKNKLEHAVHVANIEDLLQSLPLGYSTRIGAEGHGLSTGQKQRVLIARAVYKDPKYIFFDEATNALDTKNERVIMSNMQRFFCNKTVVIVAHRLSTVKTADCIVVLEKGKIVETGTHEALLKIRGTYFNLIKDQLELG